VRTRTGRKDAWQKAAGNAEGETSEEKAINGRCPYFSVGSESNKWALSLFFRQAINGRCPYFSVPIFPSIFPYRDHPQNPEQVEKGYGKILFVIPLKEIATSQNCRCGWVVLTSSCFCLMENSDG